MGTVTSTGKPPEALGPLASRFGGCSRHALAPR